VCPSLFCSRSFSSIIYLVRRLPTSRRLSNARCPRDYMLAAPAAVCPSSVAPWQAACTRTHLRRLVRARARARCCRCCCCCVAAVAACSFRVSTD